MVCLKIKFSTNNLMQTSHKGKAQTGFTLIELMIVVIIIAILAAIAIPSYRQYMTKSAEGQVQAKMQQLQTELESWRANALSYKGFMPKQVTSGSTAGGTVSYGYDNSSNMTISIPNLTTTKYVITLVDGDTPTASLVGGTGITSGRSWRMLATPTSLAQGGSIFLMTSQNLRCKTNAARATLTITATDCNGVGVVSW